jgi:hypothetical protein
VGPVAPVDPVSPVTPVAPVNPFTAITFTFDDTRVDVMSTSIFEGGFGFIGICLILYKAEQRKKKLS